MIKEDLILPLSRISEDDLARVGGKVMNLAVLRREGFPVPDAFVVPVKVYDEFLERTGLHQRINVILGCADLGSEADVVSASKVIMAAIQDCDAQDGLAESMALPHLGEGGWAVRSSAVAEDLPEASFAGQQDTFLNVPTENVAEHVRRCWASYWTPRAISYRHDSGVPQLETGIAVVIQRMVDPVCSGIMFTRDPLDNEDRMVLESSWGLGETIASGLVSPDRMLLELPSLRVIEREVSDKGVAIYSRDGRSVQVELGDDLRLRPSLEEEQAVALARIGLRIESFFGTPQDIEWSIEGGHVFILQSRPITTLDNEGILWTRAYGDEYWSDVTSPLFFSILGPYLTEIVNWDGAKIYGWKELVGLPLLKLHKGHVYFNAEVLEQVFTFNPKFSRTKELLNYFPKADQPRIASAPTKAFRRLWGEVRVAVLFPDGMIGRTDLAYREWVESFLEDMGIFDPVELSGCSDEGLHRWYDCIDQRVWRHYELIRYGMVTHSIGTNLMVKQWLNQWLDDRHGQLYSHIISGLPENKTIQTNLALGQLAHVARQDPEVMCAMRSMASDEFLRHLDGHDCEFSHGLQEFLQDYGQRSHTRELFFPRWGDDPRLVVDIVRSLLTSSELNLEELGEGKVCERQEAEAEILERIGDMRFGFLRRRLFEKVMRYAQTYLVFRENQRFYLDHILYRYRKLFVECGRRLHQRGVLERPDDVFFMTRDEVFSTTEHGPAPDLTARIAKARQDFDRYEDVLPPKFLKGNVEFDDTMIQRGDELIITGTSASPGIVKGRVRVVDSIESLGGIMEGEILVASNTDPGWTAVFSKLGGLITETGGILSHGAVVSREYGIPAVTAVKGAREIFRSGQFITLDGNEGVIYISTEE